MPAVNLGPAIVDLVGIRAGDKNEMILNIKEDGVALNLTGMTLTASARAKATDTGTAPVVAVVTVIDAATGRVNVRWPGSQVSTALAAKDSWKGVWDLQQVTGSDDPVTLIAGTFEAVPDVTR